MEIIRRGLSVTAEGIKRGPIRVRFENIISVKIKEGSTKYDVKSYNVPVINSPINVNVRIGNSRISTNGNRNNRNSTVHMSVNVEENEKQTMHEILMAYLPSAHVEERKVKYSEACGGLIFLSGVLIFAAILLFIFGTVGSLPEIFTNAALVFGAGIGGAILINVLGYIFMDKERMIKVYSQGGYYQ